MGKACSIPLEMCQRLHARIQQQRRELQLQEAAAAAADGSGDAGAAGAGTAGSGAAAGGAAAAGPPMMAASDTFWGPLSKQTFVERLLA